MIWLRYWFKPPVGDKNAALSELRRIGYDEANAQEMIEEAMK